MDPPMNRSDGSGPFPSRSAGSPVEQLPPSFHLRVAGDLDLQPLRGGAVRIGAALGDDAFEVALLREGEERGIVDVAHVADGRVLDESLQRALAAPERLLAEIAAVQPQQIERGVGGVAAAEEERMKIR